MAGRYDITIYQGSGFELPFPIKNPNGTAFDVTGYLARGQIRRHMRSTGTPIATFTCTIVTPATGEIISALTPTQTGGITAGDTVTDPRSKYVYDIEIYKPVTPPALETVVRRILEGYAYIDPEVTR